MTGLRHRLAVPARLLLDGCLALSLAALWWTDEVTLWLHLAYICVALCALVRPGGRPTALRATLVSAVCGVELVSLQRAGDLPADDLLEIPLMAVLAYLFALFAAQRARVQRDMLQDYDRLAALIDDLPLATVAFDCSARVVTWNPSAERLFGWSSEEVLGKPNPIVPPGKRAASDDLFRRLRAGEALQGVELERVARDGSLLELTLFASPLRATGGLLVLYADVRERKRAERELRDAQRRYQELIESLPLVTYVDRVDDAATNIYTSPQIETLLGWTPTLWHEDPAVFEDLLHPDDRERVMGEVHEANETRKPFESEYRMRHRDGHYVWVRDHSSITDTGGEPLARGFLLDITEEKRLEEQLLQAQKMDAIGQFAGGIAHDFNNLLTGIAGYADLAAAAEPDALVARCVAGIKTAAAEAASLTSRLLAFSRRHVPERRVVDVNEIVAETAELLERLVREDVRIDLSLATCLAPVSADPAQLKQVVLNLALNARDAMTAGGVLTLETLTRDGRVVVRVRDTGAGMDEATRARAIEPFFTTKPEGKGTGLGLSVAYGVVEGLGGTLSLESRLGKGTVVEIELPAADGAVEHIDRAAEPLRPAGRGARVLVVEDRDVVRDLAREVLLAAGFEVAAAAGAQDARAVVDASPAFDLLLTDVVMPEMSGPELARDLRRGRPELPVVYMSGYTDDVLDDDELSAPNTAFVRKPFANADLVAAVRATLDGQPWASAAFANASSPASASAA